MYSEFPCCLQRYVYGRPAVPASEHVRVAYVTLRNPVGNCLILTLSFMWGLRGGSKENGENFLMRRLLIFAKQILFR